MGRRKTKEQFVVEAKLLHGKGRYSYDKFVYENNYTKSTIDCLSCGNAFQQTPGSHLHHGCPKCGKQKRTKEVFVQKAIQRHGKDKYSYPDFVYVNSGTKGKIDCLRCNESFEQTPGNHLAGH